MMVVTAPSSVDVVQVQELPETAAKPVAQVAAITPSTGIGTTSARPPSPGMQFSEASQDLLAFSPAQREWLKTHGHDVMPTNPELSADALMLLRAQAVSGADVAVAQYAAIAALRGEPDAPVWLQRSASNGSTQALLRLAAWHSRVDADEAEQTLAIAWLLVAQQRGDPFAPILLDRLASEGISTAATQLAQDLYLELEHKRYRRGLPAFEPQPFPDH